MYKSFIEALPDKVRSTDWFEEGSRFRKRENALAHRYVEVNQLYKRFIALDIDKQGAAFIWDHVGLPPPSYIVVNPENSHCHYLYELNTPVYYTEEARRAPQKFYEATDVALTKALGADPAFVGRLVKNPLHAAWRVIRYHASYDLEDFKEWGLDLKEQRHQQILRESLEGRNTTLFDTLRIWAYVEVKTHATYASFTHVVDQRALSLNGLFTDCLNGILPAKEVLSTAKSVSKWTWKHRHTIGNQKNRGVLELPDDMPLHEKQSQGAEYSHLVRTEKVGDKIKTAIHACKQRGLSLDSGNLGKCGLSMSTFYKHRAAVDKWIKLLS